MHQEPPAPSPLPPYEEDDAGVVAGLASVGCRWAFVACLPTSFFFSFVFLLFFCRIGKERKGKVFGIEFLWIKFFLEMAHSKRSVHHFWVLENFKISNYLK